jgi:hypothetical protein
MASGEDFAQSPTPSSNAIMVAQIEYVIFDMDSEPPAGIHYYQLILSVPGLLIDGTQRVFTKVTSSFIPYNSCSQL